MILHTYQHDSVLRGSYEKKHFGLIWICIELVYSVLGFVSSSLVCRVLKFTSAYTAKTNWEHVYNPSSLFFSLFYLRSLKDPWPFCFDILLSFPCFNTSMLSICQTRTPKNRLAKIYSEALFYAIKFWIIIWQVFAAPAPKIWSFVYCYWILEP